MSKDYSERRLYRKSPGRQYGYEYDPLRSRSEQKTNGKIGTTDQSWPDSGETRSRSGSLLAQRPDLRRTRQLLRQNIIASKSARLTEVLDEEAPDEIQQQGRRTIRFPESESYEESPAEAYPSRYTRSGRLAQPRAFSERETMEPAGTDNWTEFDADNPDLDYEDAEVDPLDIRLGHASVPRFSQPPSSRTPAHKLRPRPGLDYEEYDYDEEDYVEEEVRPRRKPSRRKKKLSRRTLLIGAGVVAVGGAGAAVYEMAPKVPQALNDVGTNIERQLQDAFNKGMAQGAENVRKEFVTVLQDLEGISLEGAISAAKLTRVAYDVFVSPVIRFGSTISGDILKGMLQAFKTARGWLAGVNQDNATLAAIQKVLESWTNQVSTMPKQLDAITQTDLDGAQSYLRALQRKINDEKAKLNGQNPTSSPQPKQPSTNPTPKTK